MKRWLMMVAGVLLIPGSCAFGVGLSKALRPAAVQMPAPAVAPACPPTPDIPAPHTDLDICHADLQTVHGYLKKCEAHRELQTQLLDGCLLPETSEFKRAQCLDDLAACRRGVVESAP